jgi:hypothetical protein
MTLWSMGKTRRRAAYWVVAAMVVVSIRPAIAASPSSRRAAIGAAAADRAEEPNKLGPMTNAELQGYGCLYTGGAATVLGAMGGSSQLIAVLTGGAAVSVPPIDFALAVTGTIFAGFCAVGALGAPAVVRMWHQYYDGEEVVAPP